MNKMHNPVHYALEKKKKKSNSNARTKGEQEKFVDPTFGVSQRSVLRWITDIFGIQRNRLLYSPIWAYSKPPNTSILMLT